MPWGAVAGAVIGGVASNVAANKASNAQESAANAAADRLDTSTAQAREDLFQLFPSAQQASQQGFQGALDTFNQFVPQQQQQFQSGNVAAQNQILAGLPQMQNALLGNPIDNSQFQAYQSQPLDFSFLNQQLPTTQQAQVTEQNQQMNGGLGGYTPENPAFNNVMGPFQQATPSNNIYDVMQQQAEQQAIQAAIATPATVIDKGYSRYNWSK